MAATYPTTYTDRHGEEQAVVHNDGRELCVILRGVEFRGTMLDDFEPCGTPDPDKLKTFSFSDNSLCDCTFEYDVPMQVIVRDELVDATLHVRLILGRPRTNAGGIDKEELLLRLRYNENELSSCAPSGDFERGLTDLQSKLPDSTYMQACINCAFSDYSPLGQGIFGGLACFRDNKEAYRAVKGKSDLFAIWRTMTEFVQETFRCPEFERRKPGAGYRG